MKILIINPFGIGDVLFSTPLISNLRASYPQGYIGYICNIRAKDVLCHNPQLDEIFVFEKDQYRSLWQKSKLKCIRRFISFLMQIKRRRFDVAVDLSLNHQYSFCLWLIGVKIRIGYNYRKRGRFLTHKIDIAGYEDKPIVDYYLDLLGFLDIKPKKFKLTIAVSDQDRKWADGFFRSHGLKGEELIVGIVAAGGASWGKDFSYRHWPWQNYAQLADRLIEDLEAKVIVLGDVSEGIIGQYIQNAMQNKPINACGRTTLQQFAACLAKCNLVVCNDGGPLHVAVSQDVLTVSIFGPVDQKVYGPYPAGDRHIVVSKNIACRPCYTKFKLPVCINNRQCIRDISVDEVLEIIKANLAARKQQ